MGKTKIATIDDSQPEAEVKSLKEKVKKKESEKVNPNPELLAREKAEEAKNQPKVNPNPETLEKEKAEAKKKIAALKQVQGKLPGNDKEKKEKTSKAAAKKGKLKYRSKRYLEIQGNVEKSKRYPLNEAIDLAKASSYSKFEGSIEAHINTNVKNIRGLVSLPFASGKKLKVLAFGKGAAESGADVVGDDEVLGEIIKGKVSADVIVADPSWMPKLARAAKVLGPRGLMPNPKNGTISDDLKKAVGEIQGGKVEYKTQKDSQVIHLSLGKVSQPTEEISQNIKTLMNALGKTKTKKMVLAPSMGLGVKVDLQSI